MTRKSTPYRDSLLARLTNSTEAEAYLNAALADSTPAFLKALRNVVQAQQLSRIANEAGVQRETLYRSLSENGNPTLETLTGVLKALNLRIAVQAETQIDHPSTPLAHTA